jgi:sulfite reductase beta subunit-like hemoprotein
MVKQQGTVGFEVMVGGGLGLTPMIGKVIRDFIPPADLLPYLEAIVSVWNLLAGAIIYTKPGSKSRYTSTALIR